MFDISGFVNARAIGFTGTRGGMSNLQNSQFFKFIEKAVREPLGRFREFHHGACLGADDEAVNATKIARDSCRMDDTLSGIARPSLSIIARPCDIRSMVSFNAIDLSDEAYPARPPLDRNKDIVNASDILLAVPSGPETTRSGTWSTVRFARKHRKPILIFWPDGTVEIDGGERGKI